MAPFYSPEAKDDLAAIWAYFASERSDEVATRIVEDITGKISRLEKLPRLGRARPELAADLHSLPLSSHDYVVYYRVGGFKGVQIVRILHGRRDTGTALGISPLLP